MRQDIQARLINFSSKIFSLVEKYPKTLISTYLLEQLIRSGSSPALHYGEAQSAESRSDFVHKMKICLKELRETYNSLRLIRKKNWYDSAKLEITLKENNELISIFVASLRTAQQKKK